MKIKSVFLRFFKRNTCTCLKECDCENPPPENWNGKNGVFHTSEYCPIHNIFPLSAEDCPVHSK